MSPADPIAAGAIDVSFVVPVRNGGEFLLRAVKSVERVALVTDLAVEIVVVDDGADVALVPCLDGARLRIPVTVVDGERSGPSVARNIGARSARGTHLAFLDVDDVILPAWARLARRIVRHDDDGSAAPVPPIAAVLGPCVIEDQTGGSRTVAGPSWRPACYLVRRDAFERVGGFDERVHWGEHHQMGGRIAALAGGRVVEVDDIGPVMVKLDDRSAAQLRGYAARRHEAALIELETATTATERAAAADTASVSLARLRDWRGARVAAADALRDAPNRTRRLRRWVLRVPLVRDAWFHGRLSATDRIGRIRSSLRRALMAVDRNRSLVVASVRHGAPRRSRR